MKNALYTLFAIAICLFIGKLVNFYIAGLPGSLYGMLLYCLLLQVNWLKSERVIKANQWFIRNVGVCFVPASVGVINHFELIKHHGFAIMISIVLTTFILLTFVGVVAERYIANSATNSSAGNE